MWALLQIAVFIAVGFWFIWIEGGKLTPGAGLAGYLAAFGVTVLINAIILRVRRRRV